MKRITFLTTLATPTLSPANADFQAEVDSLVVRAR